MSFIEFFFGRRGQPKAPEDTIASICTCPNCGHGVMLMFVVSDGRLEAVDQAMKSMHKPVGGQDSLPKGTKTVADILKERREAAAANGESRQTRIYDKDFKNPPSA